jgi:uncharacterized membrane protein
VRVPRALHEYALVPVLCILALCLLAVGCIIGDQSNAAFLTATRGFLKHFIGKDAAATTLGAVATGLVTVTSITFSVLLLAVQQTASNLSPVVFDQFIRRRTNQLYLGFFVGLALYSYLVMAAVQNGTPPIIGAFVATVLTVGALGCLLFLVYSTIDQMRPDNVLRHLHDRAIRAHDREGVLVARTRRSPQSEAPVNAEFRSRTYGYIESIDLDRVLAALWEAGSADGEVEMLVCLGDGVVVGDSIALIRHPDPEAAQRICEQLAEAVPVSAHPDIDVDPTTALRDIGNIAWTSGSTSKQNPAIAEQALHALRDLGSRWLAEEERTGEDPAPVVYRDCDRHELLDALYSMLVVARESRQHQQAQSVLKAYRHLAGVAQPEFVERIERDVQAVQAELEQLPASPGVDLERETLAEALRVSSSQRLRVDGSRASRETAPASGSTR